MYVLCVTHLSVSGGRAGCGAGADWGWWKGRGPTSCCFHGAESGVCTESGHSGGNCQQQATTTCRHQHPPLRRGRHPATNTNTAVPGKTRYLSNIGFYLKMYCSSAFWVLLLCTAGFFQRRLYSHADNRPPRPFSHFTVEKLPPMLFHGKNMLFHHQTVWPKTSCIRIGHIGCLMNWTLNVI